MVTKRRHKKVGSIKIKFSNENVTAFAGLSLTERLAKRLGLWTTLEKVLPVREGVYDWFTIIKSAIMGLLSGSRGTYATQEIREDKNLLRLLGLDGAPEEVTFWRSLYDLGEKDFLKSLSHIQMHWSVKVLQRTNVKDLFMCGFLPVFGDGSLLEGSERRDGTKYIEGKGSGLLWNTIFVGSVMASQRMASDGEGEQSCIREMLPQVVENVLKPMHMKKRALLLLDSLHGDGPTLDRVEGLGLHYIIGANKLSTAKRILNELPQIAWKPSVEYRNRGWSESAVCTCWIKCEGWTKKRLLIGHRWKKYGDFLPEYSGVITNLTESDVEQVMKKGLEYEEAIWWLYSQKMGMEDYYKDLLDDLNLHHPPCQEYERNAGFYTIAALAHVLGRATDLIGGKRTGRGETKRLDGKKRNRSKPKRMRLWRLRRSLLCLPGRIAYHGRRIILTIMGASEKTMKIFNHFWENILLC